MAETRQAHVPNNDLDFSNLDKIKQHFAFELEEGFNRFDELVAEAPEEFRNQVAKALLEIEIDFYVQRKWTYDKAARVNKLPHLAPYIEQILARSVKDDDELVDTTPTKNLLATTHYAVKTKAWLQGGQGALHKAKDTQLGDRDIVVKFLKDLNQKPQFIKEANVTANLDHPGIVAVYSIGSDQANQQTPGHQGRPFYAMRLIRGETLEQKILELHRDKHQISGNLYDSVEFKDLVESLISVCNTIEYAHSRCVLHCDIKPANIKCGEHNATIVLDWGSARTFSAAVEKRHDSQRPLEFSDATTGSCTIPFASPEQLSGADTPLTAATDIYSLGATLFSLLTGDIPHDRTRRPDDKAPSPRSKDHNVPRSLEAICIKALQHSPGQRYTSARQLGDDLQRWLRDEELEALPDNVIQKTFRFARRHQTLTIAAIVVAALLLVGGIIYSQMRYQELRNQIVREKIEESGDAAFTLIDEIFEPLARDETSGSKELRRLAGELEIFCNNYIDKFEKDKDKPGIELKLAKAHQFLGFVNYYRYNNPDPALGISRSDRLRNAIDHMQVASELAADSPNNQAVFHLFEARLRYVRLSNIQETNIEQEELDKVLGPLDSATQQFQNIQNPGLYDKLNLAEAHHLRGQLYLTLRNAIKSGPLKNLQTSAAEFQESVDLRNQLKNGGEFAALSRDDQHLILRELGRGYGYLGDAQKYLSDVDDLAEQSRWFASATDSYQQSLTIRRSLFEQDSDEEYQFQLGRGYANFGNLFRDFGELARQSEFFKNIPGGEDTPMEQRVIEQYVDKSIEHRLTLYQRFKDGRYRSDLSNAYNLAGELYFFAANSQSTSQAGSLDRVLEYSRKVIELYNVDINSGRIPDLLNQQEKNRIATALTMEFQARMAVGEEIEPARIRYVKNLLSLEQIGWGDFTFEPLFAYCVALKAEGPDQRENLRQALNRLAQLSTVGDYRIQQHFDMETED